MKNILKMTVPSQTKPCKLQLVGEYQDKHGDRFQSNQFTIQYVAHPWPGPSGKCCLCEADIDGENEEDSPDPDVIELEDNDVADLVDSRRSSADASFEIITLDTAMDIDGFEIVPHQQGAEVDVLDPEFLNHLGVCLQNMNIFSLDRCLGSWMRNRNRYYQNDQSDLMSEFMMKMDGNILDLISFPYRGKKRGPGGVERDRHHGDYIYERPPTLRPTILCLHKITDFTFDGVLNTLLKYNIHT